LQKKCKLQKLFLLLVIGVAPYLSPGLHREVELKKIIILTISVVLFAGCAVNRYRSDFEFANKLAAEGLWKEAYYRWQKALTTQSGSAALHNNMAVALEGLDRLPEAEQEYQQALKLAPGNTLIQGNYDRFKKNQRKNNNEK
jgi:tetratricopeptide (TPR) repeat protein